MPEDGEPIRILTIGNSFSENATSFLPQFAEAGGRTLVHEVAHIGGASLERHVLALRTFEADPTDEAGRPYGSRLLPEGSPLQSLRELLESHPWTYVTIQQVSTASFDGATFQPWADELVAYVREHAPTAEILVHETWAYRVDDDHFDGELTQAAMYARLHANYAELAEHVGAAAILPSGTAIQNAREDDRWVEQIAAEAEFDADGKLVEVQDHSLIKSWGLNRNTDPPTARPDRHHASIYGRYLGSAVWYESLFGDVESIDWHPPEISPEDAALLREIAHATVAQGLKPAAMR